MNSTTMTYIVEIIFFLGIFYLFLILPQQRRDKQEKKMLSALKPGDEILTKSGVYGRILNIKDDVVTLEVGADKVKIKIAKWAVGRIESSNEEKNKQIDKNTR